MSEIKIKVAASIEFALFRHFAETISILTKRTHNNTWFVKYLGVSYTKEYLSNLFTEAKKIGFFALPEYQYLNFCKTFEEAFNKLAAPKKEVYRDLKSLFDNWKNTIDINNGLSPQINTTSLTSFQSERFEMPDHMKNSTWYSYALHETWAEPVIGRMVIKFETSQDNETSVSLTYYNEKLGTWTGKAYYTKDSSIVIAITHTKKKYGYTHYLLPNWKQAESQRLFIGHMTRKNDKVSTVVTKTVIFEICDEDEKPEALKFDIDSPQLPKGFSQFFKHADFQPLQAPPSYIIDRDSLSKWLSKKIS